MTAEDAARLRPFRRPFPLGDVDAGEPGEGALGGGVGLPSSLTVTNKMLLELEGERRRSVADPSSGGCC